MFLLTLAGIWYLFPKEVNLVLEFQEGQVWIDKDLRAPIDFPLLKTEEELEAEQMRLEEAHVPVFSYQPNSLDDWDICWEDKLDQALETLLRDPRQMALNPEWTTDSITAYYKAFADRIILQVADFYLVSPHPSMEKGKIIRLEKDREVITVGPGEFMNLVELKEWLTKQQQENKNTSWIYDAIAPCFSYNYIYNDSLNARLIEQSKEQLPMAYDQVDKGELIIAQGAVIHESEARMLRCLEQEMQTRTWRKAERQLIAIGQAMLICIALLMLATFLFIYRKNIFHNNSNMAFLLLNMFLMVLMAVLFTKSEVNYIYLAPFCILPLMIRAFFDTRLALFVHLISVLLCGFFVPKGFEFLFLQLIAGCVATLTTVSLHKRSDLFLTVGKIALVYLLSYLGLSLIQKGGVAQEDWIIMGYLVANAGLTLFVFPLIYLYEKVFGMVSDVSLLELSDTNSKLLRDLNQRAPGTFQHSLQVANLAEAVVAELGGNTLLMRAGALYHDIGKMEQPQFFIENQVSGMNPHDDLSFEESTKVIINHVIRGVEMAKQHQLPDRLIDFIRTHHGTTTVQYFYKQYIKTFPEEMVDKSRFAYPGPKPFSMETAVLMMTDAVEAASRSLQEKSEKNISELVDKIIDVQMGEGQFENVDLTFKDIEKAKKIFKRKLASIYHVRIAYPD